MNEDYMIVPLLEDIANTLTRIELLLINMQEKINALYDDKHFFDDIVIPPDKIAYDDGVTLAQEGEG